MHAAGIWPRTAALAASRRLAVATNDDGDDEENCLTGGSRDNK